MILDCLSPAFPGPVKIVLLCLSGSLRAACGVAGGGSKASLSVHFARAGNVGELNAKASPCERGEERGMEYVQAYIVVACNLKVLRFEFCSPFRTRVRKP